MGDRDDDPIGPEGWPLFIAVAVVIAVTVIAAGVVLVRGALGG